MKKLILALAVLITATSASADWHHHEYHRGGGGNWLLPLIIGGAVTYAVTRPSQPVIVQQPVQQPVIVQQPPYGYHWEQMVDAQCNCYRTVLVPN